MLFNMRENSIILTFFLVKNNIILKLYSTYKLTSLMIDLTI